MTKKVYMVSDHPWEGYGLLYKEGVFFDKNAAIARAKELCEADVRKENGRLVEKAEGEYWNYWKNGSHVYKVVCLEAR